MLDLDNLVEDTLNNEKYQLYDKKIVMDEAKMDSVGWKIQIK